MPIAFSSQPPDPRICEQARLTRDPRFDGLFFTAVRSTGIYCRSVCPAPTPKAHNVEYYANAAAAAAAGYRPCLRCRPEAAPGMPLTRARSVMVAAALRLIEAGALDSDGVADLAGRIGVGARHLRRLFVDELGAGPAEIALASGFENRCAFSRLFRQRFGTTATAIRRKDDGLPLPAASR